jgi:hypothetical protein
MQSNVASVTGFFDVFVLGLQAMKNKKPDALSILALLFAAGVLFSALSHSGGEGKIDSLAGYQGSFTPTTSR